MLPLRRRRASRLLPRSNLDLDLHNLLHQTSLYHRSGRSNISQPPLKNRPGLGEVVSIGENIPNPNDILDFRTSGEEGILYIQHGLLRLLCYIIRYGAGLVVITVRFAIRYPSEVWQACQCKTKETRGLPCTARHKHPVAFYDGPGVPYLFLEGRPRAD